MKLLIVFLGLLLGACSTVQMKRDAKLNSGFNVLEVTEKANALSGDKVVFGSYQATKVDIDWNKSSTTSIGSYAATKKEQSFRFEMHGGKAECSNKSSNHSIGAFRLENDKGLICKFTSSGTDDLSFAVKFTGHSEINILNYKNQKIELRPTNKTESSSFPMSMNTGFYFYDKNQLIAALDKINNKGPVWLKSDLSEDVKKKITVAIVALLLYQE